MSAIGILRQQTPATERILLQIEAVQRNVNDALMALAAHRRVPGAVGDFHRNRRIPCNLFRQYFRRGGLLRSTHHVVPSGRSNTHCVHCEDAVKSLWLEVGRLEMAAASLAYSFDLCQHRIRADLEHGMGQSAESRVRGRRSTITRASY